MSDEELAAAAHAADEAAFTVLYRRWERQLYGFFAVHVPAGALADAETLAADTLAEAWLSLRNTAPGHFSGWIHAIARNVLAAYLESRGVRPASAAGGAEPGSAAPGPPSSRLRQSRNPATLPCG